MKPTRTSIDLSGYPDLVVIVLGLRVRRLRAISTVMGVGRGLQALKTTPPDGLLAHEDMVFGLTHIGFRQYWRDFESMERFTRGDQHRAWWRDFLRGQSGAGVWHELYRMSGGMEAIYMDMPAIGFARFAPARVPEGRFTTARERLQPA